MPNMPDLRHPEHIISRDMANLDISRDMANLDISRDMANPTSSGRKRKLKNISRDIIPGNTLT